MDRLIDRLKTLPKETQTLGVTVPQFWTPHEVMESDRATEESKLCKFAALLNAFDFGGP
jgi:hypothetical protein